MGVTQSLPLQQGPTQAAIMVSRKAGTSVAGISVAGTGFGASVAGTAAGASVAGTAAGASTTGAGAGVAHDASIRDAITATTVENQICFFILYLLLILTR